MVNSVWNTSRSATVFSRYLIRSKSPVKSFSSFPSTVRIESSEGSWVNRWVLLDPAVFETHAELLQWFPAVRDEAALWCCATSPASRCHLCSITRGTCLWSWPARSCWRGRLLDTLSKSATAVEKNHPFSLSYLGCRCCWISTGLFGIPSRCWCGMKGPCAAEGLSSTAIGRRGGDCLQCLVRCRVSTHLAAALQVCVVCGPAGVQCGPWDIRCPSPPNLIHSLRERGRYMCIGLSNLHIWWNVVEKQTFWSVCCLGILAVGTFLLRCWVFTEH